MHSEGKDSNMNYPATQAKGLTSIFKTLFSVQQGQEPTVLLRTSVVFLWLPTFVDGSIVIIFSTEVWLSVDKA
jgi:hypothetical protein